MKKLLSFFYMGVLLFAVVDAANAITYNFTSYLENDFGTLSAGTVFTGSFTYRSQTEPGMSDANKGEEAIYAADYISIGYDGEYAISINSGFSVFIRVLNNNTHFKWFGETPLDAFTVTGNPAETSGVFAGLEISGLKFKLIDETATAFKDWSLPSDNLNLEDFNILWLFIQSGQGPYSIGVKAIITSLTHESNLDN